MTTSTTNPAIQAVFDTARSIEQRFHEGDASTFGAFLIDEALELKADTSGSLTIVLTVGGPHIELILGDGAPRLEGRWGGSTHTAHLDLDDPVVGDIVDTWWRPTMQAALDR